MNNSLGSLPDNDEEDHDTNSRRKVVPEPNRLHPTLKFNSMSLKSSGSSVISGEEEVIDDEDKDIFMKMQEFIEQVWEWPSVRKFRLQNSVHIFTILTGHMLFAATDELLKCIHQGIVCSKVSHAGAKISEIESTFLSSDAPGYSMRQANYFLSVLIAVELSFVSLNFLWSPISTHFMSGPCTPATYPDEPQIYTNLGDFMQGDADLALIYNFGIPLDDGIVGGWSSWPLINPGEAFSTNGDGYVFAIFVNCGNTYDAGSYHQNLSSLNYDRYQISGNSLTGRIRAYLPLGSSLSEEERGNGVLQDCMFVTKFGQGSIKTGFISDEWEMVSINDVETIVVGDVSVTQRESTGVNFIDFANVLTGDNYNLTGRLHKVLLHAFTNASFAPSQGSTFANILGEGTLPDGYYYENKTWKGVSNALAIASHYVLMQFDQSAEVQCDYYGYIGAGVFIVPEFWVTFTQALVAALVVLCGVNVWWMHLMFDIDEATDIAYRTMKNNLSFCAAISKESEYIFANYSPNIFTLPSDISHDLGKVKIFFGIDTETLENPVKEVKYGPKHRILFMKKYFRRKKKQMKAELKERRRLKEEESLKTNPNQKEPEIPQIVIGESNIVEQKLGLSPTVVLESANGT